uniref:F-box domain-containing protein n=1 Tax=Hordeum vulgare subsp. vulgare TaxID=112509 RepID=A0A8I6XWY9_HORVV
MPPPPLARRSSRRWAPYSKNWLAQARHRRLHLRGYRVDDIDNNGTNLPDDVLSAVFSRLSDTADVVRCANTCRHWGRVVAKEATILSRALPPLPRLALGFFHTERPLATARTRNRKAPTRPRFVPLSSGARLLGFSGPLSSALSEAVEGAGHGFLDHSRPVASRMGRLLLELRREGHADGLSLCVCNPMTGDMALLPPVPNPGFYACTVLCGDDLDPPRPSRTFFRVLIVYNRHRHTAMRSYSSDSRCWSREVKRPGPKIKGDKLRKFGQGLVLRGVAYWPLMSTVLAVRLDTPEPAEVPMPAGDLSDHPQNFRLLGATPDGRLTFIRAGVSRDRRLPRNCRDRLLVAIRVLQTTSTWERKDVFVLPQFALTYKPAINVRWFGEKSGILLFTLGDGSNNPGAFALNVETHEIEKLATGVRCSSWDNLLGYEMDGASYLASITCP